MYKLIIILSILSTLLVSCTAEVAKENPAPEYLACYALSDDEKTTCINGLNQKYIDSELIKYEPYTKEFQFAYEKLGFKKFILQQNLPCNFISEGPIFMPETKSYLVICGKDQEYLMQFNYENNHWKINNK